MNIRISPSIVEKEIKNIDGYIKDYASGVQSIRSTVDDISNIWKDKNYQYFYEQLTLFLQDLSTIEKTLQNYQDFLDGYMNAGKKIDSFYQNKRLSIK